MSPDWFSFGNSWEINRCLEILATGEAAQDWCYGMEADRASHPEDRHLPWKEQREFDPSVVDEIGISDDQFDPPHIPFLTEKVGGTPIHFVNPCDLHKEV